MSAGNGSGRLSRHEAEESSSIMNVVEAVWEMVLQARQRLHDLRHSLAGIASASCWCSSNDNERARIRSIIELRILFAAQF